MWLKLTVEGGTLRGRGEVLINEYGLVIAPNPINVERACIFRLGTGFEPLAESVDEIITQLKQIGEL